MNPLDAIDLYCERTDASLWSEPFNALTNLAFIFAAWLLWHRQFPRDAVSEVRTLASLIFLIGIGSGIFHIIGTVWGSWLDSGFIALFIVVYIHRYLTRLARWPGWLSLFGVLIFLVADRAIAALGSFGLNGSEGYLLPAFTLVGFALWARQLAPSAVPWLTGAAAVFAVSFTLRTLDMALCPAFPLGTHFGWHILNAVVLFLCVRGLAAGCHERSLY